MIRLREENVHLQAQAVNKLDAIRQAGNLLVQNGNIQPGYIDSMLGREKVANTYLGNGIAIPHGLPNDRELIIETGVSVLQVPGGVEWNPGEMVYIVVGIAAKSDEHIGVLTNLTHVLDDLATIQRLTKTTDPAEIVKQLTEQSQAKPDSYTVEVDYSKFVDLTITGRAGLHARPATAFVTIAKTFESDIRVRLGNMTANGKSMISLLQLGVECGRTIRVSAQGKDEDLVLQALKAAVEGGLEAEEEQPAKQGAVAKDWVLPLETRPIPGIIASPGFAIAPAYQLKHGKIIVEATAKDPALEVTKLKEAIEAAKTQLNDLYIEVKTRSSATNAAIFQAHREFLEDPETVNEAIDSIGLGHSAGWSWQQAIEKRATALEQLNDPLLAARALDLLDVGQRVLKLLGNRLEDDLHLPECPFILIADDLTPSDTASLNPSITLGFCTAAGGPTSHTAIIARSLDIPALVGIGPAILNLADGTVCILDGAGGNLYPNPTVTDLQKAEQAQKQLYAIRESEKHSCYQPAMTIDGHRVEIVANIGAAAEAEQAVQAGAEGVGLLRTEFLFLNRQEPPSEAEQFEAFRKMTDALNGLPLIIRTLDVGGDKSIPYLNLPREDNPFLGVRGIRLCLLRPDLFRTQLRAIFRASQTGFVRIMFPMISTLEDLQEAKRITEEVRREMDAAPVEIGIMIEVPSAVVMADEFAREVDFFSVGTNDLTQYTLAIDRGHPVLAKQADGLHPAVLRMIDRTVQAAAAAGKWVGVCGGMAGDPKGAAILIGLGVAELSISIPSLAAVKAKIRQLSFAKTKDLAKRALACRNAKDVRALM